MADMAPMWPGSPDWPSSQRTHLLPMSAAHVLNNCNDKLATAKLGPNSIGGRPTGGQGVVGSGLPIRISDGNVGVSQVPWKPWWSLSMLFDPGRIRQAEWTMSELPDTAPACVQDESSKRLVFSGLNHTTFDLAVYASQDGSPHHHARLASGCWSSFARRDSYPQGLSERFQSSSLFLPSKAYLTQEHHT